MLQLLDRADRLTLLLAALTVAATGALVAASAPDVPRFVVAAMALAAVAAVVARSIDQVGDRLGPGPTGLLQSTLGNLPELFVGIFALRDGLATVVQAALVGSILGNTLLVTGGALVAGGLRHGIQRFPPEEPRMVGTLLSLAVAALVIPTLAVRLHTPAAAHRQGLSDADAILLLVVYLLSIPFWLRHRPSTSRPSASQPAGPGAQPAANAGPGAAQPGAVQRVGPGWPLRMSVALLLLGSLGAAFTSDWFVGALRPATHSLGISPTFTGLVVVAVASNAVENAVAVQFALKARPDFAMSITLASPLQVALMLTPVLVLLSNAIGPTPLSLVFPPLLVAAVGLATVVVVIVVYDGEYTWLEGVALLALYGIVAASAWWG